MAGLRSQFFLFFLVSFFVYAKSENTEKIQSRLESDFAPGKSVSQNVDESLKGENPASGVMSDSSTETEQIIDQKVLDIVKNPVNADLNKLPIEVIEKIAEGGVTTPKIETKVIVNSSENVLESVTAGGTEEATATTTEGATESTTTYPGKESRDTNNEAVTVFSDKVTASNENKFLL